MTTGEWFISICTVICLVMVVYVAVMFWLMWEQVKRLSDRVNELEASKIDKKPIKWPGPVVWDWADDVEDRRVN